MKGIYVILFTFRVNVEQGDEKVYLRIPSTKNKRNGLIKIWKLNGKSSN